MALLGAFAALATILALLGVYGVMSYLMNQRTREVGIRMALGATSGDIVGMVLGRGLVWVAVGLGIGIAGAVAFARLTASLLFGVSAIDPWTFAAAALLLGAAATLALYLPARRAARVEPLAALRDE